MSSFNTYLSKIQDLTDKNLQMLTLINSAFYSNSDHVSAIVGDSTYTIPSFLHIENKLNDLDGNWKRLVDSPLSGEATFVLDGNTRKIQIAGYETSPKPLDELRPVSSTDLFIESNDIFKDFITPLLSVRFDLGATEDAVHEVCVRKVIFKSQELQDWMDSKGGDTAMVSASWMDVGSKLEGYTEDSDYVMYDKIYRLPIRTNDYSGSFVVKGVDVEQDGKNVYWNGVIDGYTYSYDEGKMTADLKPGDILLTEGNGCKLVVSDIDYNAKAVTLRVLSGYYSPVAENTLTLYVPDEKKSKIISVPLEEDTHIAVFISPMNSDLNTGAAWSGGQLIWPDRLKYSGQPFREVYNSMVKNVGDILNDLTSFVSGSLSGLSESDINLLTTVKPQMSSATDSTSGDYDVILLNDHLLDNAAVDTIRRLNNEKAAITADLQVISNQIQLLKSELSATDLSDQVATYRQDLQNRLDDYNSQSVAKTAELINKINELSQAASNTVLPGSGSKYVIRGAVPTAAMEEKVRGTGAKALKVEILYRYKNVNKSTSNATAISDALTVGDWNKYIIDFRQKTARWDATKRQLVYDFESETGEDNTAASWRVFNIPIQQGETVDFRCRVMWDLGWPYVSVMSGWCDVTNVEFPEDLVEYADVKTIVTSNNTDASNNVVRQELLTAGVTTHINDEVIDQDQTYFHRPESISSGFYTDDSRRVIPLATKLRTMSDDIAVLKESAFANSYKNLRVTVSDSYNAVTLDPEATNIFNLPGWNDIDDTAASDGTKTCVVTITLENNNQSVPMNIYSMFPGPASEYLKVNDTTYHSRFDPTQYVGITCMGVVNPTIGNPAGVDAQDSQRLGQMIYFRRLNKWNGNADYHYGGTGDNYKQISVLCTPTTWAGVRVKGNAPGDSYDLPGGTAVSIPLTLRFKVTDNQNASDTIAFDIWTSPFQDPVTYVIEFKAKYDNRALKRITDAALNNKYSPVIRKPVNSTGRTTIISPATTVINNNA